MPRRRRRQAADHIENRLQIEQREYEREERASRRPGKRGRWSRRVIFLAILMMLFALFLPNLIGWTGIHQTGINMATASLKGAVRVRGFSAGWFQPVTLSGVELLDEEGKPILTAEKISTSNRLYTFLTGKDWGTITIDNPSASLVLREGGSNLEDVVVNYVTNNDDTEAGSSPLPPLRIVVNNGTARLTSVATEGSWLLNKISLDVQTAEKSAIAASMAAEAESGSIKAEVSIDSGTGSIEFDNGTANLQSRTFDLAVLTPILERIIGPTRITGVMDGTATTAFSSGGKSVEASFDQASIRDFNWTAERVTGSDVVRMQMILATGEAALNPSEIVVRSLELRSDIGELVGEGQVGWDQLANLMNDGQLAYTPFRVNGRIDLVGLSKILPATMSLHEDLQVHSGEVKFGASLRNESGTPKFVANLETLNLAARRGDQDIEWQKPLRLVGVVSQLNGQLQIEELQCNSDFLELTGSGNAGSANFEAQGDLGRLVERLGQFCSLEGFEMAGSFTGKLTCNTEGARTISSAADIIGRPLQINGDLVLENPVLQFPGAARWEEPQLRTTFQAVAQFSDGGSISVQQGVGQIFFGNEVAAAQLAEAIPDIFSADNFVIDAGCRGRLQKWIALLRNFVDPGTFATDGTGEIKARVTLTPRMIFARNLNYRFEGFSFDGYGMSIREEQLGGEGNLDYEMETALITARDLTLIGSSVAAATQNIKVAFGEIISVSGQAGLRGDINRIGGWFGLSDPDDQVQYFGNLEASIGLASNADFIDATIQGTIADLIAAQADHQANQWVELLHEPNVVLGGVAGISQSLDDLRLQDLRIDASSVSAVATGRIRNITESFDMEIDGIWLPDWQSVNNLLAAYSQGMVSLAGREQQRFSIRGPLFEPQNALARTGGILPEKTRVQSELKWDSGTMFLLPVGPADITAALAGNMAKIDTGEIAFGGGTLTLRPELDLSGPEMLLTVPAGKIASNVKLTPEFCRDWMKYVAPLLADVATAEGSFSLQTSGVRVPIDNPYSAEAGGMVTLHNVTVGAGPLAQQLIQSVESVRLMLRPDAAESKDRTVWMNLGEQQVPFAVRDGRVFHDGLVLQIKDLKVTTRGSVGMDQSLQMVAVIPIHDDWLNGQKFLEGLRGASLEIPVSGTVSKPVLDKRAIQQLGQQLLQRTAQAELNRVVGEQTGKLQQKANEEIGQLQNKINSNLEDLNSKVREKMQGEVLKGLGRLFGEQGGGGGGGGGN